MTSMNLKISDSSEGDPNVTPEGDRKGISNAKREEALKEISNAKPEETLKEISNTEPKEVLKEISNAKPKEVLKEFSNTKPKEVLKGISKMDPKSAPKATSKASLKAASLSPGQRKFLESELLHKHQVRITRMMLLVLLLALWELAARFSWIDSFIFSSPSMIFQYFCSMVMDRSIFLHTGVTLMETILSFFLVIFISLLSALLLWSSRSLSEILDPYLVMLNSLPKSAMAPLLIVWLGNNTRTIIVAAISVALFGSILTLHTGFSQTDPDKVKLIYSLGGTKKDVLVKVLLPSSVPLIISSMKVNIGLCLVGVIIGEFLSSKAGLGYLITYGSQTFQMTLVVTSIVVLCIISALLYQLIALVEKRIQ